MSSAEEIKSKLDIIEVIKDYIQVKAYGANFKALCPFHREKTPSFVISPDKQIWHCFGCGKSGDVLSFVQEMEGLSFPDTLRLLAPRAGVVLQNYSPQQASRRGRILDCLLKANIKYQENLTQDPVGQKMKEYLLKRSLSEKTIKDWQVGYSPDSWTSIMDYLKNKGFSVGEISASGLSGKSERGTDYDRFRDRITFPIYDVNGALIAYTARINPQKADDKSLAKYINSPKTEVYDKSRVLFGLDKAKLAIKDRGYTIIVEGQMDAIACHQHDFSNTVASSGTALTEAQLLLLKRFSNNIALCFDGDSAGQLAADRGIIEALRLEMNVKIVVLSKEYKDPDECLRENPEDFKKALSKSLPVLEYYFIKLKEGRDLSNLNDKKDIAKLMLEMINRMDNRIEQDYWLKRLAEDLEISEQIIREALPKKQKDSRTYQTKEAQNQINSINIPLSREEKLSEIFLALLLKSPEYIIYASSHLEPHDLRSKTKQLFYKELIIYYNKHASFEFDSFTNHLKEQTDNIVNILPRLTILGEKDYYNYDSNQTKLELTKIIIELKKLSLKNEIKKIQIEIAHAESAKEDEKLIILMTEIKNLNDELNSLQLS